MSKDFNNPSQNVVSHGFTQSPEPLTFYQKYWQQALPVTAEYVVGEIFENAVERVLPNLFGAEKLISEATGQFAGSVASRLARKV